MHPALAPRKAARRRMPVGWLHGSRRSVCYEWPMTTRIPSDEALRAQWRTVRRAIVLGYALLALMCIPLPFRSSLPSAFIWSWVSFVLLLGLVYLIWGFSAAIRGFLASLAARRPSGDENVS